jgi:hypothetical protein
VGICTNICGVSSNSTGDGEVEKPLRGRSTSTVSRMKGPKGMSPMNAPLGVVGNNPLGSLGLGPIGSELYLLFQHHIKSFKFYTSLLMIINFILGENIYLKTKA